MKNIKYSGGTKAFALIIEQMSVVLITISIFVIFQCIDTGYDPSSFMDKKEFLESSTYSDTMEKEVYNLLDYIDDSTSFETNGVYDINRVVDIKEYAKYRRVSGEVASDSVGYYLGDLLTWAKKGLEYTQTESGTILVEKYLPVDNIRLSKRTGEIVNLETLMTLQSYLEETIYNISDDVITYKQNVNKYEEDNTNISFYVTNNATGSTYTNISEHSSILGQDNALANIKELGNYLIIKSGEVIFDSNMEIDQRELYNFIGNMSIGINDDYTIGIGVNTKFPIKDSLYEVKTEYEKLGPYFATAVIVGITSVLALFISFIYLNFATGHKVQGSTIYLNNFDKIKTEIAAIFMIGLGAVVLLGFRSFFNISGDTIGILYYTSAFIFIENILFLIGYLSLVRRIKAGTFWSNSLIYSAMKFVKDVFKNMNLVLAVSVLYGAFLIVNAILSSFLWDHNSLFALFLLILLNGMVGVLIIKEGVARRSVLTGVNKIAEGDFEYKISTADIQGKNRELAVAINNIGNGIQNAVEANMKNERLKTDLITNVSHDIKTPLTSIINYVDLLKREEIEDEKIRNYINILDSKSQRLKHLTEDLVEASKISSGNIVLNMEKINFVELIHQTNGEFAEKFNEKQLEIITSIPKESVVIEADGRRVWRIIENLYNNVAKYALEGTRVYIDLITISEDVYFSVKNISAQPLNISAEELTERFIRGDVSRSTEGSGLGLSIAKNLTELQKGRFSIYLDGDLFKVTVMFQRIKESE